MPYSIPDAGAILVNKQGKRYVNEKASMSEMCLATDKQPGKVCFMVFDKKVADIFNKFPMSFPPSRVRGGELSMTLWLATESRKPTRSKGSPRRWG